MSTHEFPVARPVLAPRRILMVDGPNPFARRKRVRRIKLALLALLCGGAVAGIAYAAATFTAAPHSVSSPLSDP